MWINIIQQNFKELLETLKKQPMVIFLIATMFTTGYFMNKWTSSQDNSNTRYQTSMDKCIEEKDSLREEVFKYKYQAIYWRTLLENRDLKTDSLIRTKLKEPLEEKLK